MARRGSSLHKTKILRDDALEFTVESGQQALWPAFVGISLGLVAIVIIIASIRECIVNNQKLSAVLPVFLLSLLFIMPLSLLHLIPSYKTTVTFQKRMRKILVKKHKLIKIELPSKITFNHSNTREVLFLNIENIHLVIGKYSNYLNHRLSFLCNELPGASISSENLSLICEITDKVYEIIKLPITIIDKSENQGSSLKFVLSKLNKFKVPYSLK